MTLRRSREKEGFMRIAVIGFGYVGSVLAERLATSGHEVFGVRRSKFSHPELVTVQADVTEPRSLAALPPDLDRVIYAVSPGSREDEAYRLAYPVGLANLINAVPQARIIFVSSTAVYPQKTGETVDENSATEATSFSSQRLLEAEKILTEASRRHVIVRSSGIYGEGRTRLISQLATHDLDEETRQISTSRIHRADLAGCLAYLTESAHPRELYVASDPHPATLGEMQLWVRQQLEGKSLVESRSDSPTAARNRSSRRLLPTRLLEEGFQFHYPSFREGYLGALGELISD